MLKRVLAFVLAFFCVCPLLLFAAYADDGVDTDLGLSLGYSEVYIEPPDIAGLMRPSGMMLMSIGSQPAYPYTGGAFIAANTNYGNGLVAAPEPFKKDTFGFVKGTNRVVNLTNGTVTCYWIMGGTTYNARFQRYGELEYQYTSGGTTTWRTMTMSAVTDSNVQFLDETGERGIQRPYLSLESKVLLFFVIFEVLVHTLALFKGR